MTLFNWLLKKKNVLGKKILSGHDISDGGLITCLLEMAFAGYCGIFVDLSVIKHASCVSALEILFAEECGWVLEVYEEYVNDVCSEINVPVYCIGTTLLSGSESRVRLYKQVL